jgi:hypothetical protein
MKKSLLAVAALILVALFPSTVKSQSMGYEYKTALGIKFFPGAISIKHFIHSDRAIEGLGYFWDHGFRFTGLYEIHGDINGAAGLKWYIGPGAHLGVYNDGWYYKNYYYASGDLSLGLDGVLGLDYKIRNAPINLSLDFQPSLEIISHPYFSGWGGLGIRYTF